MAIEPRLSKRNISKRWQSRRPSPPTGLAGAYASDSSTRSNRAATVKLNTPRNRLAPDELGHEGDRGNMKLFPTTRAQLRQALVNALCPTLGGSGETPCCRIVLGLLFSSTPSTRGGNRRRSESPRHGRSFPQLLANKITKTIWKNALSPP